MKAIIGSIWYLFSTLSPAGVIILIVIASLIIGVIIGGISEGGGSGSDNDFTGCGTAGCF